MLENKGQVSEAATQERGMPPAAHSYKHPAALQAQDENSGQGGMSVSPQRPGVSLSCTFWPWFTFFHPCPANATCAGQRESEQRAPSSERGTVAGTARFPAQSCPMRQAWLACPLSPYKEEEGLLHALLTKSGGCSWESRATRREFVQAGASLWPL